MASVKLVNITKYYDSKKPAVDNASFEINDKEFVVLVGPSGCGKSTTLRMIAGLEEISSGELYIDDRMVNDVSPKDRDIAMVFQNYALYPHMSVYENMAFGLKLRKVDKNEIKKRVMDAAEILGIVEYLDRKPKALSGGQRQRVAVGRAIVRQPKVFLFDEPLSNLDAKLRVQMRTEISKLHKRLQATIVYVTHDQTEAMTMGDRIVVMKDAIIQQIDSPLNLYNFPNNIFVAGFIGSPAMNFIEGKITDAGRLQFVTKNGSVVMNLGEPLSFLRKAAGKDVTLGIRPEDILCNQTESEILQLLQVNLDVVEPMGNEIIVYTTIENQPLIARLNTQDLPEVGKPYNLYLRLNKLHFFEKATGNAIRG